MKYPKANSPRTRIFFIVLFYAILNEALSALSAIFFLWNQDWFGKGDLTAFLYYSVAHSIMVGIFTYLNSKIVTMKQLFLRIICAVLVALLLAMGWTLGLAYIVLGPWIGAMSIPIFYCWLISGSLTLVTASVLNRSPQTITAPEVQKSKKRIKQLTAYFSMLLVLPPGLGVLYLVIFWLGVFSTILFSWQFKEGAIISSGHGGCRLTNKNLGIFSDYGRRRIAVSAVQDISIYHALIEEPDLNIIESANKWDIDGPLSQIVEKSLVKERDSTRWVSYSKKLHTVDSTLEIGLSSFHLRDGNLFYVKLDSLWNVTAIQFPVIYDQSMSCSAIVEQFNKVIENHIDDYPLVLNPRHSF